MTQAFERIAEEYQDRIYRLALAILRDPAAAEEAAQDALLRIWKGLPKFRGDSALSTWVYSITRNCCISASRRAPQRAISLEEPGALRRAEQAAAWQGAPQATAEDLLAPLPAKYRQVAVLFYMQEKSYDEVAEMLGLPLGTVKTYLFRARKAMAEQMARERVRKGDA